MSKFQDLTGQKFGRLVVLSRSETKNKRTMWLCECDCGNQCIVRADALKSNKTTSCGCAQRENTSAANFKNEVNKKYGFLTVIKPSYEKVIVVKLCGNVNVTVETQSLCKDQR